LYLFSNAVDDLADGITHVIRGQDGVRNAPRQVLIYQALGVEPPVFAHVNLTLDPGRAKISKRKHGEAVTVDFYRRRGFLPWALLNFLLLLGWSSQSDQEFFSRSEAIERFSLSGLTKANSVFDYRPGDPKFFTDPKAISINAHYLRTMPIEDLEPLVVDELKETGLWRPEYKDGKRDWFLGVLELIRARFHTLKDFTGPGRPYFTDDFDYDPAAIKKNLAKDDRLAVWLPELAERLKGMSFDTGPLEKQIRDFAEEKGVKAGLIINAVRTAVTGQLAGPGLFDILAAVGRESTVRRLERTPQLF
jgi:glutamyl-tRNA synthetase